MPIQIDIGFGDAITPGAVELEYPTMLDGPAPRLRAYPVETVVAEKFEALVSLGLANTRMKDFYDLWLISRTFGFEGAGLAKAIRRTFERRRTNLPLEVPTGLSDTFAREKAGQWRAFLRRERLASAPDAFDELIDGLRVSCCRPRVMPSVISDGQLADRGIRNEHDRALLLQGPQSDSRLFLAAGPQHISICHFSA